MSRYLMTRKLWVYNEILYSKSIPKTAEMFNHYSEVVKRLNELRKYADEHPNNADEIDASSFSITDYLNQYCQEYILKNLINDLFLPSLNNKCMSSLSDLFEKYASNYVSLISLLSIISQCFSDIYEKCIGYAPPSLLKVMYNLIEILNKMVSVRGFKDKFFEICGNNLLNIVLSPDLRTDHILLWKVSNFLIEFDHLPIRVTQLIGFMIISGNEKVLIVGISLSSKFSFDQLCNLNSLILNIFDNEIENEKRLSIIIIFIKYYHSIVEQRESKLYSILKGLFKNFSVCKNEKIIDLMSAIMNKLVPLRIDFNDISSSNQKITEIPPHIKEKNPKFWKIVEDNIEPFSKLINDHPIYLNQFKFYSNILR